MTIGPPAPLRAPILISYVLPALVISLPTIPVYIHLPALYGVQLGLGLAATGVLLLVARLFDAVSDPIIGILSDRFAIFGVHRKPWIAVGAVIAGLGLYHVLAPPEDVSEAYLLIWLVVLYGGWTMVSVPYLAWGAELSADYDQRTRVTAWREGIALIGIVGAGVLGVVTTQLGWTESRSISAIAWLAILSGIVVFPLLLWKVPDTRSKQSAKFKNPQTSFPNLIKNIYGNKPFLRLLLGWFLNGIANGIPAALFFIYLEHGLGAGPEERPVFILIYFVAAIAAIPIWLQLSRRFDKHYVWCSAMAMACLAFMVVPLLPTGAFYIFAGICVFTGMALGADLALPPAIQADVIDYHKWKYGQDNSGLQFALWGMGTKFALALSVGLALPALDAFGFDPDAPPQAGLSALVVIYALVPVVIKGIAIAIVWPFPITRRKHTVLRQRLDRAGNRFLKETNE